MAHTPREAVGVVMRGGEPLPTPGEIKQNQLRTPLGQKLSAQKNTLATWASALHQS